jgi:hypothetical protein
MILVFKKLSNPSWRRAGFERRPARIERESIARVCVWNKVNAAKCITNDKTSGELLVFTCSGVRRVADILDAPLTMLLVGHMVRASIQGLGSDRQNHD